MNKVSDTVVYEGSMFQVLQWEGKPGKTFEAVRRAPGVRILAEKIKSDATKAVYLTKEIRREAEGVDYRLPGGKVFDSLKEYNSFEGDILELAKNKARQELKEEAGISTESLELISISTAGASVDWDLYYYLATGVTLGQNDLQENEVETIVGLEEICPEVLFTLLRDNKIQEGRSATILWQWLALNKYIQPISQD
jgi:ADP-ribose pyrophosphatase YjhB (NUDIX family)